MSQPLVERPVVPHDHKVRNHGDGKDAWCKICGRNAYYRTPKNLVS